MKSVELSDNCINKLKTEIYRAVFNAVWDSGKALHREKKLECKKADPVAVPDLSCKLCHMAVSSGDICVYLHGNIFHKQCFEDNQR